MVHSIDARTSIKALLAIANSWTAAQRFNDNVLLTFGDPDGTDADVYYDGTNLIVDVNSGDLNVVIAGSDLNFQQATSIKTTTGALTLAPASDTLLADATGLVIGHTAQLAGLYTSEMQVLGTANADATMEIWRHSNDAVGARVALIKSKGTTVGSSTATALDDVAGEIMFAINSNSAVYRDIAIIKGVTDGTPGVSDAPGRLEFWTTLDGAGTASYRAALNNAGVLILGTTDQATTARTGNTFRASDMVGGTTSDAAGADLTIGAGLGTGTGDAGQVIFSLPVVAAAGTTIQTRATRLTLDMAAGASLYVESAGTGAAGMILKNMKNAAASALSGTQLDVEIDIGGTPYYFTVYPTKA